MPKTGVGDGRAHERHHGVGPELHGSIPAVICPTARCNVRTLGERASPRVNPSEKGSCSCIDSNDGAGAQAHGATSETVFAGGWGHP